MTREELLDSFKNFSDEELKKILESRKNENKVRKDLIPHKDLNEDFIIINYRNESRHYETFEDFEKYLRSILKRTPYGVNTYIGYDKFLKTLDYGASIDEIVDFIKSIFIEMTEDASLGAARSIELFNSRNEIIWYLSYKNDIIRNLEDFSNRSLGSKFIFKDLINDARNYYHVPEELLKDVSEGLNYISDFLYFKDGMTKNEWEMASEEKVQKRTKLFEKLKLEHLSYKVSNHGKEDDALLVLFSFLERSYRY